MMKNVPTTFMHNHIKVTLSHNITIHYTIRCSEKWKTHKQQGQILKVVREWCHCVHSRWGKKLLNLHRKKLPRYISRSLWLTKSCQEKVSSYSIDWQRESVYGKHNIHSSNTQAYTIVSTFGHYFLTSS